MTARRAARATLVAVAAVVLGTAAPAAAEDPTVTITSPNDGDLVTDPNAILAGTVTTDPLHTVKTVTVTRSNTNLNCDVIYGAPTTFSCRLPVNGRYNVVVTASDALLGDLGDPRTRTATRSFNVAVPPAAPEDVKVELGPDRRATISWVPNREPDVTQYRVQRFAPGSSSPVTIATVRHRPGDRLTAVDQVPPAGGNYGYVVIAVRPGVDGVLTTPSGGPVTVEVAAGPGGDAGPGAGAAGGVGLPAAPGAARGSGGARGPGGVPSLLSGLGGEQPLPAVPEGEAILPGDDGFALPGAEGSESADPAVLDDSSSVANQRALFVPLAAGLLLCVIAFHLRQFNRTVLGAPAAYQPMYEPEREVGGVDGDGRDDDRGGDGEPRTAVLVGANGLERAERRSPE